MRGTRKGRRGRLKEEQELDRENVHTKNSLIYTDKEMQPCSKKNHFMRLLFFLCLV